MNNLGCKYSEYKIDCPNMKEVETSSFDYELYKCDICGETLKFYYEDMA